MKHLATVLKCALVICTLNYAGELCAADPVDSLIISAWAHTSGSFPDTKIPLSDPNRNQFGCLSGAGEVYWYTYNRFYSLWRSDDYGETKADSIGFNSFLGYPTDHAHIVLRNDSLWCAYPGTDDYVNIGIVDATGGTFSLGTVRHPIVEAGTEVYATRFHPFPDGDSAAIIWRTLDPRTYDVSCNFTDDFGVTAGSRVWVEDLEQLSGNGGRLGACWFNNSIMAGIYDRDVYYGLVWYDRAAQAWATPDTLWSGTILGRWYDLQSINDTTIFAGVSVNGGAIDTIAYAAKHLGQASYTYGRLALLTNDIATISQSVIFTEVKSSKRMVAFYGHYYASGNLGINMRWFSPEDSLTPSTTEYVIVGDSVQVGGTQRRFAGAAYVPATHGDVAYLYYSDPATSTYRIVKVEFVGFEPGEENYRPMTISGGTVSGGTTQ